MAEPVTLEEAKYQCRMEDDDSDDTFITSLIAPARALVERRSRRLFVGGERTETFNRWGDHLEIWRSPITSVDTIEYGSDGTGTAYTDFQANLGGFPLRISAGTEGFPELADGETVTVTYTAGELSATSEEYLIGKRAILLLIGFWYDNRGEVPLSKEMKLAFDELLGELGPAPVY